MRSVVDVLESQAVPVDGRLEVALVDGIHEDLRALRHLQRGAGDRSVVGEHANGRISDLLGDGRDPELELVAVRELDQLGSDDPGSAGGFSGEILSSHGQALLLGPHRSDRS
jgi:hypothetical protein